MLNGKAKITNQKESYFDFLVLHFALASRKVASFLSILTSVIHIHTPLYCCNAPKFYFCRKK